MPLSRAQAMEEPHSSRGRKAMANISDEQRRRHWWMAAWLGAGALLMLPFYVMQVTDGRDDLVLTRNEVVQTGGDAVWRGAFTNRSQRAYRRVAVEIRFLDEAGAPVGSVARRTARLEPGEQLTLDAPLASRAAGLQIQYLSWRVGEGEVEVGPRRPRPLGRHEG